MSGKDENVTCWSDLSAEDKKAALESDSIFESLKSTYPNADFSERDRLLQKYAIRLKCRYCDAVIDGNFLIGIPEVCPQCKRKSLNTPTAPGAVADWLLQHYRFATTEDKDQNLYVYDEETGVWSDEKADAVLKKEASVIYGDDISTQKINNLRLALQSKTFVQRNNFSSAIKKYENKIFINLKNGVLDLLNLTLEQHAPNYYFLGQIDVAFDSNAPIPEKFLEFLAQITMPNEENFISLLEAFAYPLLPGYPIQRAVTLVGSGDNGKTTYLNALQRFYGERYISHITVQQLSNATQGQPFSLTQLAKALANVADDLPSVPLKDVGYFKMLTGESSVEAERKFGNRFTFKNAAKFYFSSNKMPAVSEDTLAFYRRFIFVEFSNAIPHKREMEELLAEILSEQERSGVLNLLILFVVQRLLKQHDFSCAKSVEQVQEQYQRHSNTAAMYCQRRLELNAEGLIPKEDIWHEYQQYCENNGLVKASETLFWRTLKANFPQALEQRYQEGGINRRVMRGLSFAEEEQEEAQIQMLPSITLEGYFSSEYVNSLRSIQGIQGFPSFNKYTDILDILKKIRENVGYPDNPSNLQTDSNTILANSSQNSTDFPKNENITSHAPSPFSLSGPVPGEEGHASVFAASGAQAGSSPKPPGQPQDKLAVATKVLNAVRHAEALGKPFWKDEGQGEPSPELLSDLEGFYSDQIKEALRELEHSGDIYEVRPNIWRLVHAEINGD